jgi:site-specific DNA recombinase
VKVKDGSKERPKLQLHPHHAPVVARIFREFLAGAGLKDIARTLNSDGILTPRGKKWSKTTLHRMLTNEAYTGTLVWGRTSRNSDTTTPIRVEGAWEPIVDREMFNRVQSLLRARAPVHQHPRRVSSHYLLSGLARCGHCGKALVCQEAKSGQFSYYICSTLLKQGAGSCPAPYLNSKKFEKLVIDKIKERILTEKNLRELVRLVNEEMDAQASETRQRPDTVRAEIADINRRLERLYDALESGKVTLNDLSPRIQFLRHREDQLQALRLELEGLLAERKIQLADEKMVRTYVENLRDLLTNSSMPEQKAFIHSFVKEVKVIEAV